MAVFSGKPSSTGDFCRQPRTILSDCQRETARQPKIGLV